MSSYKTIAISLKKSDIGKTTTVANPVAGLHQTGRKTMLVDIDQIPIVFFILCFIPIDW
jgi:septum formation inhibitor-activating ATPase MinD